MRMSTARSSAAAGESTGLVPSNHVVAIWRVRRDADTPSPVARVMSRGRVRRSPISLEQPTSGLSRTDTSSRTVLFTPDRRALPVAETEPRLGSRRCV